MTDNSNRDLEIKISVDEANTIIEALGALPFAQVYKIIEKIHLEAKKKSTEG